MTLRLILASGSPRRRRILQDLGLCFETIIPEVLETDHAIGGAGALVRENARRKWGWCFDRYPDADIIAADTTVELDGRCLGKPVSRDEAFAMLRALAGRMHTVHTGYVLSRRREADPPVAAECSRVHFRTLSDADINDYLDAIRPYDRAGAYDIDAGGERLIRRVDGSRTNVMGLPAERIQEWLACRSAH